MDLQPLASQTRKSYTPPARRTCCLSSAKQAAGPSELMGHNSTTQTAGTYNPYDSHLVFSSSSPGHSKAWRLQRDFGPCRTEEHVQWWQHTVWNTYPLPAHTRLPSRDPQHEEPSVQKCPWKAALGRVPGSTFPEGAIATGISTGVPRNQRSRQQLTQLSPALTHYART